jgi:hypothetical protein
MMQRIIMYAAGMYQYLKSVLRYNFLILDTYHPDAIYLREQGCDYFSKPKGIREQNRLGNNGLLHSLEKG